MNNIDVFYFTVGLFNLKNTVSNQLHILPSSRCVPSELDVAVLRLHILRTSTFCLREFCFFVTFENNNLKLCPRTLINKPILSQTLRVTNLPNTKLCNNLTYNHRVAITYNLLQHISRQYCQQRIPNKLYSIH